MRKSRTPKPPQPVPAAAETDSPVRTNPAAEPDPPESTIAEDIMQVLQQAVQAARENPTANNVNALVKALNAVKLAQMSQLTTARKHSKKMISAKVIAFIEKEILGLMKEPRQ